MNSHRGEYKGGVVVEIGMDLQDMPMQRGSVRVSTDLWQSEPRSHTQTNHKQTNLDNTDSGTGRGIGILEKGDGRGRDNLE